MILPTIADYILRTRKQRRVHQILKVCKEPVHMHVRSEHSQNFVRNNYSKKMNFTFQTKHGNLNATNAYPQLDTSTRPGKLCPINPIANITC